MPQVRPSFGLTWGQCATTFPTQVNVQRTDVNLGHQAYAYQEAGPVRLNDWSAHKLKSVEVTTFPL